MTAAGALDDYSGAFDPDWTLTRLSRPALAQLCREYMLVAMYHDRGLLPHVAAAHGQDATIRLADIEWMSSSPIYTMRNKTNLGVSGDSVADAFKGLQFDVGAPHRFLDFNFEVIDHDHGFFWLPFCGAHDYLRQLSNNDAMLVTNMCHHMEDRTFDATLGVTNPKLRAEPIHRPPKPDEFTGDHCRWEVSVDPDAGGARPGEEGFEVLSASAAATFAFELTDEPHTGTDGDMGLRDYSGDFLPQIKLEDFSHAVLVRQAKEFALDVHLLMRAAYWGVDNHFSPELLDEAAPQHRAAIAPSMVTRLRRALGIDGDDIAAVAKMLQVDPFLVDDYVRYDVDVTDDTHGTITIGRCAAWTDDVCRSPLSWLHDADAPGFEHTAQAVNPRARVNPIDPGSIDRDVVAAWDIVIDPDAEPVTTHWATEMTGGGGILDFDMGPREVAVEMGMRS
jgi:hypothetical protein